MATKKGIQFDNRRLQGIKRRDFPIILEKSLPERRRRLDQPQPLLQPGQIVKPAPQQSLQLRRRGNEVGDHGHRHAGGGGGEDAVAGVLHGDGVLRGGAQGLTGQEVDLRVRLAVLHLVPGDDGGEVGAQTGHLHPPLRPGPSGGGGQRGGDAPLLEKRQNLPDARLHGDALPLHAGLGVGGAHLHKGLLGELLPKQLHHFAEDVRPVLAHKLQVGLEKA